MRQFCSIGFLCRFRQRSLRFGFCLYIWMSHMITRCCVIYQTSCNGSPRTGTVRIRTLCFERPRVARCTRTKYHRRPIDNLRHWTRHWFLIFQPRGFLPVSIFFDLVWKELIELKWPDEYFEMSVNLKNGEDDSIRQGWFCLSSTCLRVGIGIDHFDLDFLWSKLILSKLLIKQNSVGLGKVSHLLILPKKISWLPLHHLQPCKTKRKSVFFAFVVKWSTLNNSTSSWLTCVFVLVLVCFVWALTRDKSPCTGWFSKKTLFQHQCAEIQSGNTIHAQTNIQRNNFRLKLNCERLKCFLHIQLEKRNARLPKIHRVPPGIDFESSKSPAKSESWNNPNLQAFVTSSGSYCDNSC